MVIRADTKPVSKYRRSLGISIAEKKISVQKSARVSFTRDREKWGESFD